MAGFSFNRSIVQTFNVWRLGDLGHPAWSRSCELGGLCTVAFSRPDPGSGLGELDGLGNVGDGPDADSPLFIQKYMMSGSTAGAVKG